MADGPIPGYFTPPEGVNIVPPEVMLAAELAAALAAELAAEVPVPNRGGPQLLLTYPPPQTPTRVLGGPRPRNPAFSPSPG